jgi:hypothetical protein
MYAKLVFSGKESESIYDIFGPCELGYFPLIGDCDIGFIPIW